MHARERERKKERERKGKGEGGDRPGQREEGRESTRDTAVAGAPADVDVLRANNEKRKNRKPPPGSAPKVGEGNATKTYCKKN